MAMWAVNLNKIYMAGAGSGAGAEISNKGGAGAEDKSFRLRKT